MSTIKLLSYNIHKGFTVGNRDFILSRIRESIRLAGADLVCLQEVLGEHSHPSAKILDWPTTAQFEFLADEIWPHYAYGRNSVYDEGHHGNAILSRFPIAIHKNHDISTNFLENRGMLHAEIDLDPGVLHVFNLHLDLFQRGRRKQIDLLCKAVKQEVEPHEPLFIVGDFNDWTGEISKMLKDKLGCDEAFIKSSGSHARTFPAAFPILSLDRIYTRNLEIMSATTLVDGIWKSLSDHAAIMGEFNLL